MSFDAIIKALRDGANQRNAMAADAREAARRHQDAADECKTRAESHDDLARCFDLLADALGTGRITHKQLREIVNAEMLGEPKGGAL